MTLRDLERRWKVPPAKLAVAVLIVGAAVYGILILANETNKWWIVAAVALFAAIATIPAVGRRVLQLACAATVGILVLLGAMNNGYPINGALPP